MTNQKISQKRGFGFWWLATAILIVSGLGIWNARSLQELFEKEKTPQPAQQPTGDSLTIPPLPTLVPLQTGLVITPSGDQPVQPVQLRDVAAQTPSNTTSTSAKPIVINTGSSSTAAGTTSSDSNVVAGTGSSGSAPVTSTGSSRP